MRISHKSLILLIIALIFVSDGINSVLLNLGGEFYRVSIYVRLAGELYFLWLLARDRRGLPTLAGFFFLCLVFVSGTLSMASAYSGISSVIENFVMLNKMVFFFISFKVLQLHFANSSDRARLLRLFEVLLVSQAIVIVVAFAFDLRIFAAYPDGQGGVARFGYQGLIPAQNEISVFFIIAFFYFAPQVVHRRAALLMLSLVVVAALATGTKVSLLLFPLSIIYIVYWLLRGKTNAFLYLTGLVCVLLIVGWAARDYILHQLTPTIDFIGYRLNEGYTIIYVLTGGRSALVPDFLRFVSDASLPTLLVGGYDQTSRLFEMDVLDVFARLGLIGGVFFYVWYLRTLLPSPVTGLTGILFVITLITVSTFAGHVVYSAIAGTYMGILLISLSPHVPHARRNMQLRVPRHSPQSA